MSYMPNSPIFIGNVTGGSFNNLNLAALAVGFTLTGGTSSKTLQINKTITLDALSDSLTLNIGPGGTLGTAAFLASTSFESALGNPGVNGYVLSSLTNGTRSWIPMTAGFTNPMTTLGDIIYENATPAPTRLSGNTSATMAVLTQTGNGSISAPPTWTLINSNNGICGLDGTGKVALAQLPSSVIGGLNYQGTWNASTNSPALANGVGTKGYYYKVSTPGTTNIDGNANWTAGDLIAFDGTVWEQIQGGSSDVISVNGATGVITVAAVNQTMYLGTTALIINATTGTQTVLAGMTSITSTVFIGNLTGNVSGTAASFTGNLTGDVTSTGMATTLAATTVTGKTLTNYAIGTDGSQLAATDTLLAAFQKLQVQINVDNYLPASIITKTTTYNPTTINDKVIRADATSGAFAITLLAAPTTGQNMTIKKIDASVNAVTINGNGKNIDTAASYTLSAQGNAITIIYNGTSWDIV